MFADAEDIQADPIGELNLFEQMVHAFNGTERQARGWIGDRCRETINTNLHLEDSLNAIPRNRSPRVKMDGVELGFYLSEGYRDQRDHA